MAEIAKSKLEQMADGYYDDLGRSVDPKDTSDALLGLSLTHLQMEPGMLGTSLRELVASVRGQRVSKGIANIALYTGSVLNSGPSPLSQEHAVVLYDREHQRAA